VTAAIILDGQTVELTSAMLEKYDVPGPRYTSYPTAPMWDDEFGPDDAQRLIRASNEPVDGAVRPLSLYTHLPFCEQLCLFCGCNVIVRQNHDHADAYLATLKQDVTAVARLIDKTRPVIQFHWGGGTPTYFASGQLEELFAHMTDSFTFAADAEIGVEIDPRVTTPEHLRTLRRLGFNRISMGLQDFDPEVQAAVKRVQSVGMVRDMVEQCRELGFESVNIDLMYGLPLQSADKFAFTVDRVIELSPDRIALFNYGHVPWIKKYQQVLTPLLPSRDEKFAIFSLAMAALTGAGYAYVGMDHFARPNDELCVAQRSGTLHRNFQGYTTKAGADLIGFGVTSIGELNQAYVQNWRGLDEWRKAVTEGVLPVMRGVELSLDDVIHRAAISAILCQTVIDKAAFREQYGVDVDDYFADAIGKLQPLIEDGLVAVTPEAIRVTPLGRVFLRNIAMAFDAYLEPDPDRPMYSRTV